MGSPSTEKFGQMCTNTNFINLGPDSAKPLKHEHNVKDANSPSEASGIMFLLAKRRILRHMCTNKAIEAPIYLSNSSY